MYLLTGKHINPYLWEELPINDKLIIKVEELAENKNN